MAPVTSTVGDIPSEVALGVGDGMAHECAVNLDRVQTIARSRLGSVVTTLKPHRMREVRAALHFALGW